MNTHKLFRSKFLGSLSMHDSIETDELGSEICHAETVPLTAAGRSPRTSRRDRPRQLNLPASAESCLIQSLHISHILLNTDRSIPYG